MRFKLDNVTFGTFLSKEIWIIEGNLHSAEYILKTSNKLLHNTERELLKLSIRSMKSQIKRLKKRDK